MSLFIKQDGNLEQLSGIAVGGKQLLVDIFYPVGTYYETSIESFDPNKEWGGTWVQDTKGLSTVGAYESTENDPGSSRTYLHLNSIYGESKHILTVQELAKHRHALRVVLDNRTESGSSLPKGANLAGDNKGWSSFIREGGDMAIDYEGSSQGHNNVQPSIGVIRWHRIA